jgi:hypothetical protein
MSVYVDPTRHDQTALARNDRLTGSGNQVIADSGDATINTNPDVGSAPPIHVDDGAASEEHRA